MAVRTQGNAPVRKVIAGGIGGSVATIIIYIINRNVGADHQLDGTISAAITTLVTFLVSYVIPPGQTENNIAT